MLSNTCKIFIGGISSNILESDIIAHFKTYCDILDCVIIIDKTTKQSRGFGFITVDSYSKAKEILSSQPHSIKGTIVECKPAFPKEFNKHYLRNKINQNLFKNKQKCSIHRKLFVGGLPPTVDKNILRSFFQKYGEVEYSIVMTEKATDKPRDLVSVENCLRDKRNHIIQGKQIECKKANPKPNNGDQLGNILKQFDNTLSNSNSRSNKSNSSDNNYTPFNNNSCNNNINNKLNDSFNSDNSDNFSFNFFLPKQIDKDINAKSNKKNNLLWEYNNHYVNPTSVNTSNSSSKSKLKYNFRHLEEEKTHSFNKEESIEHENEPINLFIYHQDTSCSNNNKSIPKHNMQTTSNCVVNKEHSNLFENYFNNDITNPKLNEPHKFRLFDVNGEDVSILSSYQNTTKVNLFKIESEESSTNDKDSYNSIKNCRQNSNQSNNSNDSSRNNSNSSSVNNNITSSSSSSPYINKNKHSIVSGSNSSKYSDSIVAIGSDYKDSDEEQKPNDSYAYYGPRIHKASKFFSSGCNFHPY